MAYQITMTWKTAYLPMSGIQTSHTCLRFTVHGKDDTVIIKNKYLLFTSIYCELFKHSMQKSDGCSTAFSLFVTSSEVSVWNA